MRFEPGQTLLLYTDGLTEARPGGAFFGEDGLLAFLTNRTGNTATRLLTDLTKLIDTFDPSPTDGVALLAMSLPA